jgi:hypothetical protein
MFSKCVSEGFEKRGRQRERERKQLLIIGNANFFVSNEKRCRKVQFERKKLMEF